MDQLAALLTDTAPGEFQVASDLLPLVYDELRKLASFRLHFEQPDQTLQATALVHEAYLRLMNCAQVQKWNSRGHFFAAAAEAMRRILVEQARRKRSLKAGGELRRQELIDVNEPQTIPKVDLLALHEALTKLERKDERKAALVKLRFFAGLTNQQAAEALGVSVSTANNEWAYAKTWLRVEMSGSHGSELKN